jgi:peptidoglycan/xylan/chitin deacetylase (PgdA/CDA1 family)
MHPHAQASASAASQRLSLSLILLLALATSCLHAGPPERWDVTIQQPAPHNLDIYRGETLDFRPKFLSYSTPYAISTAATVTLYWSTNNFVSIPWGTNGTVITTDTGRVSVTWTPQCDAGATTYQYFVSIAEPSGSIHRARGTITMRPSPGWSHDGAAPPTWYPATLIPTNILTLKTGTLDTDLVLKPDGAGGVAWGTDAGGAGSGISSATATTIAQTVVSASGVLYRIEWLASTASLTNSITNALTTAAAAQATADAANSTGATHTAQIADINGRTNVWNSALTNESDTLSTVLARGHSAGTAITNLTDLQGTRRRVFGFGLNITNINVGAIGAEQAGENFGRMTIGDDAFASVQAGYNDGVMVIDTGAEGAQQRLECNSGGAYIGPEASGAGQFGQLDVASTATNNGVGAFQLFKLTTAQSALTTSSGDSSLLLGAGISSNKNAIVAGDGQESHGNGSITAGGGFYGSGSGITGITAAQVGAVATSDVRYLAALTNGGAFINGNAISNGANITLSGGSGTTFAEVSNVVRAIAFTNGGATINGNLITNGAAITITGSGGPSYLETTNIAAAAVAGYSNAVSNAVAKAGTAWQNPSSATNWTWTSDGTNITLTGYTGPAAVVIPDMLDGLPVTGFGSVFQYNESIISVSGGANVTALVNGAFNECLHLSSVSLPNVTTIEANVFNYCPSLASISLPNATTIGRGAFVACTNLASISLPNATTISLEAFFPCPVLTSVYFGQNAPDEAADVYTGTPNATNYVTNPQATGWTNVWNGRPVVRLPVYADEYWRRGTNLTDLLSAKQDAIAGTVVTNGGSGATLTGITASQVGAISNLQNTCTLSNLLTTGTAKNWETHIRQRGTTGLVTFTFDDTYSSQYTNAKPVFDAAGVVGSVGVVVDWVGSDETRLSWTQITNFQAAGWEIMSHSKNHTSLNTTNESTIREQMDTSSFTYHGFTVKNFVWPWGDTSVASRKIAFDYYRSARGAFDGQNTSPINTYNLYSYAADTVASSNTFKAAIDTAKAGNSWVTFYMHDVTPAVSNLLAQLIAYAQANGVEIVTLDQGLDRVGNLIDVGESFAVGASGDGYVLGNLTSQGGRFKSTASDLRLELQGANCFRNLRQNLWTDSASSLFWQLGGASDNLFVCGLNGSVLNRLYFNSDAIQLSSSPYTTTLLPTSLLQVDNGVTRLLTVSTAGITAISSNTTIAGSLVVSNGISGSVTATGGNVLTNGGSGASLTGITAAQIGAVSNTPAGIEAAGGLTGGVFSVGTSVSNLNGTLYIPTNLLQGATGPQGPAGTNGATGATGPAGAITNIAETAGSYDNTTPITITFTNWNQAYAATITSTGTVTFVFGESGAGVENWMNLNIVATGAPSFTWPAKMWHFANGTGSSNAPAPSKYGRIEIVTNSLSFFSCQAWTNVPFGGQ